MEKPKKIVTVTLNPAVDITYTFDRFQLGHAHRPLERSKMAGGKGINVSRVSRILGEEVKATGFLGGADGQFIQEQVQLLGIEADFISITEETRRAYSFLDQTGGDQTEVMEQGPMIDSEKQDQLKQKFLSLIDEASVVVVSGSAPKGVTFELYRFFLQESYKRNVKLLLDTSGKMLVDCLSYKPYLVKPNRQELEQIVGYSLVTEQEIWNAAEDLASNGIELVIISDGANGSFVIHKQKKYRVKTPKINVINPVGSGDSFVAGVAVGLVQSLPITEILALASACGAANAVELKTGYVQRENVENIKRQIMIEHVSVNPV